MRQHLAGTCPRVPNVTWNVQDRRQRNDSLVGIDGSRGLFADLAAGNVPSLTLIAPNQCDDQHGRNASASGEDADKFCAFAPGLDLNGGFTVGDQQALNPGLIQQGDLTIQRIVEAIKASQVWEEGHNAIVIVWDENDYSDLLNSTNGVFPPQNQNDVVLTVELNKSELGVKSSTPYTSFSLLKSVEAGFGLPCLNRACDAGVAVISDPFASH